MDRYCGLIVFEGGEILCVCYWDSGVVWNDFFYQVIYCFQFKREWNYVQQQYFVVWFVVDQNIGLNCCVDSDYFIWVDSG